MFISFRNRNHYILENTIVLSVVRMKKKELKKGWDEDFLEWYFSAQTEAEANRAITSKQKEKERQTEYYMRLKTTKPPQYYKSLQLHRKYNERLRKKRRAIRYFSHLF